jgi:membrane protease subunit HflC
MNILREQADRDSRQIGVEIVDVRLRRVDLADEVSDSVYQRMRVERQEVASKLRAQGFAEKEEIQANAEKQERIIITEAFEEAQKIKGRGDAKAARIYADTYSKNQEFYDFYRSLEAYKKSFNNKGDIMVLDADSDFFKYLRNSEKK